MEQSPRLSLSYVMPSQAQKHVTVNETFRRLDALVNLSVKSRTLSAEPSAPSGGDAYILSAGASGAAWDNFSAGDIAAFQDGAWALIAAVEGLRAWVADESTLAVYDGAAWTSISSGGGGSGGGGSETSLRYGVNATADNTNRFSVKSDVALLSHDDVTPGSGDARQIINKAGAANTASVLFQNGFSGRAEFGLSGDDDFRLRVSSDGSLFRDAAMFDRESGAAAFPAGVTTIAQENLLANGGFDIWQRGDVSGPSSVSRYSADRWYAACAGASATVSRQTVLPGDLGEQYTTSFLRMQMNASAVNAGIDRREEAPVRFMGRVLTYSFWARADVARSFDVDFSIVFGAGGSSDAVVSGGAVSIGTGWQKFTVTASIPAPGGFVFGTEPRFEARIRHAAAAAWRLDIAQAKLEASPVATPFVARDPGRDLSDCLRYLLVLGVAAGSGSASAPNQTQRAQTSVTYPSPMRVAPVVTLANMAYSGANVVTADGLFIFRIKTTAVVLSMKSAASGSLYWEARGDIMFDAEI